VYLSSLIRSVIALHNLINNKLSNKEAERAVADDADKDKHKVRLDERNRQPTFGPTRNLPCICGGCCGHQMAERSKDGCARSALLRWRQIKDRELASKYYHSIHVSVSPRITQVAVTQ
jgi:hypothetical protein